MGELIHLGIKQEGSMLVVSSRIVADNFDKRHDNVIRDIEELIGGLLKIEETQAEWSKSLKITFRLIHESF